VHIQRLYVSNHSHSGNCSQARCDTNEIALFHLPAERQAPPTTKQTKHLIIVTDDFAPSFSSNGFVVGHDTVRGGHDELSELTGREQTDDPLLDITDAAVKARGDNTALVEATVQVNDDLATTGIVNDGELVDVALGLHEAEDLDQHLGDGVEDNL